VAETCIVGVQLAASIVKALTLRVSDQGDVYANYSMSGVPEAHASYHASGQQHLKKGGSYVEWDAGPNGAMEPMKIFRMRPGEVITRVDCGNTIGWEVKKLATVLPVLSEPADMLVDARALDGDSILGFRANVIGPWAKPVRSVSGFPVVGVHKISGAVQVELIAFVVSEAGIGLVATEDL
jgi:hypothetical protein